MEHEDCVFCKIIEGDIPSANVYEDDKVYAFLDISQVTKGHTLVIPKEHTKNMYETSPEIASDLFYRIPKIAQAIKKVYKPLGMNILNNNEAPAEQSVFHLHIHLIPRYGEGDGYQLGWTTHGDDYSTEDLNQISSEIQAGINKLQG